MRTGLARAVFVLTAILALFPALQSAYAQPTTGGTDAAAGAAADRVADSVVKVLATQRYPDVYKPWTKQAPRELTGSGVVIDGKRILTAAHVVLYANQVQVQANQAGDKVPAMVEAVAPGIDLAVLKLDDDGFFNSHPALPRASTLPDVKDSVMTYGYPTGGTSLSITKGIVSRIEYTFYNFPASGLRVQIDAALNAGNSGGPAVVGDKMIGLAFSSLRDAQNIGYIIPCEEIELFLEDIADGRYEGKPGMFDDFQTLDNPVLRTFLKLDKTVRGLVVTAPFDEAPDYPLKKWDVITKIGDTPIDEEGMVKVRENLRVRFLYLIQKIARNGQVPLTIVRQGKEIRVKMPLAATRPMLIPDLSGAYPSYFLYGPLVFSRASLQFVRGFTTGTNAASLMARLSAAGNPLVTRLGDKPRLPDEDLVVVSSPLFPHRASTGYSNPAGRVVKAINGIPIRNLRHLVEVLRDSKAEFTTVEFEGREMESLVFSHREMLAATEEVLTDNGIRSQGTPDTLAVWNAKPR